MIQTIKILHLLLIFAGLLACSGNSNPTDDGHDTSLIEKSVKRGLAYNLTDSVDLDSLKSGVSWWYNWYFKTDAPASYYQNYQMEFIPMLWGGNGSTDFTSVKSFILNHPEVKYLLVLNEPNLTDQANQTPAQAAQTWKLYEQLISELADKGRTIALVGPAMNWGTMSGYADPVSWLDAFYNAYHAANSGTDPKIDYLAFHWYDFGLSAQLERLKKYGKQIWITEMANWNPQINTYEKQAQQMTEMVALCENRDDVFRYAWFIGRGSYPDTKHTYLFNTAPGDLTDLGRLYLSLPYSK